MEGKSGVERFLELVPVYTAWHKVLLLYSLQLLIFIVFMVFFWWISSKFLIGALIAQLAVSTYLAFHFIYMADKSEKIREKYRKKYGRLAGQHFWLNYLSYINPIVSSAFYFPLILKNNYFLFQGVVSSYDHLITRNIFPEYIAIPFGVIVIIIGLLIRKPSGGYGIDVDGYLYTIFNEKGKLIKDGIFKFIRNPQYLCRGIIAVGFGVIANNLLAILVGLIHFISYCAIIPAEDRELTRRFGAEFEEYRKKVPALLPKYENWKKFLKLLFS